MSKFEMENQEAINLVHKNPNRTGVKRTVGMIVPIQEAQAFREWEERRKNGYDRRGIAIMVMATVFVLAVTLAALLA